MLKSSEFRVGGLVAAATLGVLALVLTLPGSTPFVLLWICIYANLALALRFMMLVGEVNLAIGAFYGIGAYTAAKLALAGAPFLVATVAGAVLAGIGAYLFGKLALRATGASFILVSFAFNEALRLTYTKSEFLGGNSGLVGIFAEIIPLAITIVLFTGAVVYGLWLLEKSRWGLFFSAVEGKPRLAAAVGIDPTRVKMLALVLSSVIAGATGGLFAHYSSVIAPQDFSFQVAIAVLAYVMIGGRYHLVGPVLGTALLTAVSEEIRVLGAYEPAVYGVALMVAMVFMPKGLTGFLTGLFRRSRSISEAAEGNGKTREGVMAR